MPGVLVLRLSTAILPAGRVTKLSSRLDPERDPAGATVKHGDLCLVRAADCSLWDSSSQQVCLHAADQRGCFQTSTSETFLPPSSRRKMKEVSGTERCK